MSVTMWESEAALEAGAWTVSNRPASDQRGIQPSRGAASGGGAARHSSSDPPVLLSCERVGGATMPRGGFWSGSGWLHVTSCSGRLPGLLSIQCPTGG